MHSAAATPGLVTRAPARSLRAAAGIACAGLAIPCNLLGAEETEVHELSLLTVEDRRLAAAPDAATTHPLAWDTGAPRAGTLPTLARQFAGLPGLVTQEGFGGIDPPRLSVRGSGLQSAPVNRGVLWMLDGLPLNATDGTFPSAVFEPAVLGTPHLTTSPGHPWGSTMALGGSLTFGTDPDSSRPGAWLSVGPDGYRRAGANSGARTGPRGSAQAAVAYAAWDGWRPNSSQDRLALAGSGCIRLAENGPTLTLSGYAARTRLEVPGPLTLDAARRQPRSLSPTAAADRPRRETRFGHLALDLTWGKEAGEAFTRAALAGQHSDDWFRQLRSLGLTESAGPDLTALLEARRTLDAHTVSGGALVRSGSRRQSRWMQAAGVIGPRFADLDLDSDHTVVWLDDSWAVGTELTIDGGISFMDAVREAGGTPLASGRVVERGLAHRIGLSWQAGETLVVRARVLRGLEPPAFDDLLATRGAPGALALSWSALRAQRSNTIEFGLSGSTGALAYACAVYTSRWSRELLRLADTSGAPRGTINAGPTEHDGVEAALRWRLAGSERRALHLALTHTWSRAAMDTRASLGGRDLAGLPPHAGSGELAWLVDHGWTAAAGASWTGGTIWADHANTLGYSGATLGHARIGWVDRRGWSIVLEVDNLLDRAAIASTAGVIDLARNPAATTLFLPALPRQVRISATWRH